MLSVVYNFSCILHCQGQKLTAIHRGTFLIQKKHTILCIQGDDKTDINQLYSRHQHVLFSMIRSLILQSNNKTKSANLYVVVSPLVQGFFRLCQGPKLTLLLLNSVQFCKEILSLGKALTISVFHSKMALIA